MPRTGRPPVALQLWQLTTRFWEGWKVPASRMFEVGMVVEI
jgi:hypothetical protein